MFHAGGTTGAFVLKNIPGFPNQPYFEVSRIPFHAVNFGIGKNFNIGVPADLDQFGREYSH
jgi:hypothetical protein